MMERKEFIKKCGLACVGFTTLGTLLQSCVSNKSISADLIGDHLTISKEDFKKEKDPSMYHEYVIVRNKQLQYPIYVFRFSDQEYSALYLKCTHQGVALNAYGDKLVCTAHGSEFDNRGRAMNGPAIDPLRSFPIKLDNQNILISLKKS
jgi:Rieske Fe-S protein